MSDDQFREGMRRQQDAISPAMDRIAEKLRYEMPKPTVDLKTNWDTRPIVEAEEKLRSYFATTGAAALREVARLWKRPA